MIGSADATAVAAQRRAEHRAVPDNGSHYAEKGQGAEHHGEMPADSDLLARWNTNPTPYPVRRWHVASPRHPSHVLPSLLGEAADSVESALRTPDQEGG